MKRIMSDVAVQTLLYTMRPQTEVIIFDYPEYMVPLNDPITSASDTYVYTVDEILHDYKNVKIAKAKIRRTEVKDGKLFIMIDTRNERY